ncbi:5401_t:CDS:2, partial [Ambispora leptoticha]
MTKAATARVGPGKPRNMASHQQKGWPAKLRYTELLWVNMSNKRRFRQDYNVNWILSSSDPTPLAFFRMTHPTQRVRAIENYRVAFAQALGKSKDDARLRNDESTQRDWEIWLGEKKTISVHRSIHDTNVNIQNKFNSGVNSWGIRLDDRTKDVNEKKSGNNESDGESDEGNGQNDAEKVCAELSEDNHPNNAFVERLEAQNPSVHTRRWILPSGTDVGKTVKDQRNIVLAIDRIMPEVMEEKYGVTLSEDDQRDINAVKLAVMTYAENLGDVDLPVSESPFDNSFPNMLTRRFLDRTELKMDVGEICCWASAARRNDG